MYRKIFLQNKSILKIPTLKNSTVIITGGATGLGKSMAKHFAENDVKTIICSRNLKRLQNTTTEINKITKKENVICFDVDVSDDESVSNFYKKLELEDLNPDILINNAAGNFISRTEDLSNNAINRIIDIVLKGTVNMTLPFSKNIMNQNKMGNIINISTLYAETGSGFVVPSAISKAGINSFTKSLASEWGKYGLRFNAISPGSIYTEGAFSRLDPTGEFIKSLAQKNPSGRLGSPEELANLVLFLSSDYSYWLNGQIINFDGGEGIYRAGQFNELNNLADKYWERIKKK